MSRDATHKISIIPAGEFRYRPVPAAGRVPQPSRLDGAAVASVIQRVGMTETAMTTFAADIDRDTDVDRTARLVARARRVLANGELAMSARHD